MKTPLYGLILGGGLGIFDGLFALVSAPEVAPQIAGIVIGVLLAYGFCLLQVSDGQKPYYWQIMLPGGILGVIVGFASTRHARMKASGSNG